MKSRNPVHAIPIEQRNRRIPELRGAVDERFGQRGAVEKRKGGRGMQLDIQTVSLSLPNDDCRLLIDGLQIDDRGMAS
jgi:hypothetical protein